MTTARGIARRIETLPKDESAGVALILMVAWFLQVRDMILADQPSEER